MTKRVAIVTGGSKGIGSAIVERLCRDGFVVYSTYNSSSSLAESLSAKLNVEGFSAFFSKCDVGNEQNVSDFVDHVVKTEGQIDVLVNNAGITKDNLIMRMSEGDWNDVLNTNLTGAFHFCRAVARPMMSKRTGRIINIGSIVGLGGNAGQSNYSSSKAGLVGLTKSLAKELSSRNILVNCIAPGYVETEMTEKLTGDQKVSFLEQIPLKRPASSSEIASVVSFLSGVDSSYITGQILNVDGGLAM